MRLFFGSKIIFSSGALDYLKNIPGNKCFIVTDKNLEDIGLVKTLTEKLDKLGKAYEIFNEVRPDPHEKDVLKAKELCISYKPDLIIGFGGGSSMDTAKVVWALYEFPNFTLDDIEPDNSELYNLGKKSKMVAIPTTSGTGAETTFAAVISRFEDNLWKKLDLVNTGMMPTYSIVDPTFSSGMPPSLTIDTGFDALAHSFEAITSRQRNKFSDAICIQAIDLIFDYLPIVYQDGKNVEARDYMHQAATMASLGENNSPCHLGHTMGYGLGTLFKISHGKTVGITLPYVLQFLINNPKKRDKTCEILANLAKKLGWAEWKNKDNKKIAIEVVNKIKDLQKKVNFPSKFEGILLEKDFEVNLDLLIKISQETPNYVLSPRKVSFEDFKKIFVYAFEGKDIDF
ncbi:MAG: iron-containing alcohol dehydrogenase [Promethearchaeota archaeon]|nr:MAG: iron-containing alcohol dehydrogenase [Candidatus Lokiarchaeota archaeon]